MTISDSIPIQFWLNGQETFNEKSVCGITKQDCFCQPFQCTDSINIQISDSESKNYALNIKDESGSLLVQLPLTSVLVGATYYYSVEFTFTSQGICNENVQLEIVYIEYSYTLTGSVTAPIGSVTGTATYVDVPAIYITGSVTAPMATVDGDVLVQSRFRFDTTDEPGGICADTVPYDFAYHVQPFGANSVLYEDAAMTTILVTSGTPTYVRKVDETDYYDYDDGTATAGAITYNC